MKRFPYGLSYPTQWGDERSDTLRIAESMCHGGHQEPCGAHRIVAQDDVDHDIVLCSNAARAFLDDFRTSDGSKERVHRWLTEVGLKEVEKERDTEPDFEDKDWVPDEGWGHVGCEEPPESSWLPCIVCRKSLVNVGDGYDTCSRCIEQQ